MSDKNTIMLSGKLGQDLKRVGNVVSFSLVTNRYYKDKDGNEKQEPTLHSCVAEGNVGEYIAANVKKGTALTVIGHTRQEKYAGVDGKECERTQIEIERISLANVVKRPAAGTPIVQKKEQQKQQIDIKVEQKYDRGRHL
jgi:single stranded DNA-binding protein